MAMPLLVGAIGGVDEDGAAGSTAGKVRETLVPIRGDGSVCTIASMRCWWRDRLGRLAWCLVCGVVRMEEREMTTIAYNALRAPRKYPADLPLSPHDNVPYVAWKLMRRVEIGDGRRRFCAFAVAHIVVVDFK